MNNMDAGMMKILGLFTAILLSSSLIGCADEQDTGDAALGAPVRVRRNVKDLTVKEREQFVEAVLKLKKVASPYDPQLNYYDQFVTWHLSMYHCDPSTIHSMMMGHGGPAFLPWHREFLLLFEDALRTVGGDDITVPYWDWTDPESVAVVFQDDFMGGDGDPSQDYAVTTGPFRKGNWEINVSAFGFPWVLSDFGYVVRHFGSFPDIALPTPEDVSKALSISTYDVPPYDSSSDSTLSFRNFLEGFVNSQAMSCEVQADGTGLMNNPSVGRPILHNAVHSWIGGILPSTTPDKPLFGTMTMPSSLNDPVFFLHHANIDRIWAEWQEIYGIHTYQPVSGAHNSNANDPMLPFNEINLVVTPDAVADIKTLGVLYQ